MGTATRELLFPFSGINRSTAIQSQPPFTCFDALNVWPRDPFKQRQRGGRRAGLDMFAKQASANPIRLLHSTVIKSPDPKFDVVNDSFDYASMSHYTVLANATASTVPSVANGMAYTTLSNVSFDLPTPSDFNSTSAAYRLSAYVVPYLGSHGGGQYELVVATNSTPTYATCVTAQFTITSTGSWTAAIVERAAGTPTTLGSGSGNDASIMPGRLEVERSGSAVTLYWRGTSIATGTISSATGTGTAVVMRPTGGAQMQIDWVSLQHSRSNDFDRQRPRLLMSQGGVLYRDTFLGQWAAAGTMRTLASDRRLMTADFGGNTFIADYSEPIASGINGVLTSTSFDSATYTDWTTPFSGKKFQDYCINVTSVSGAGVYRLLDVASGSLTTINGSNLTKLTFRVERCPKYANVTSMDRAVIASGTDGVITGTNVFDSATYASWNAIFDGRTNTDYAVEILSGSTVTAEYPVLSHIDAEVGIANATNATGLTFRIVGKNKLTEWRATAGSVPVGCSILASFMGSAILAADPLDPNEFYVSKIGDWFDWDFTSTVKGAAYKGSLGTAGKITGGITAVIPYADTYCLFCVRGATFRMIGHPSDGGSILPVDSRVGAVSKTAWCYGADNGEAFLLTNDGIYVTRVDSAGGELARISRNPLPNEFLQLTPENTDISMTYDLRNRGIHVFLTPKAASAATMPQPTHWFFDLDSKGFFRIQYASNNHCPTAAIWYQGLSLDDQCALFGTYGGDTLRYSHHAENDCGQAITDYVLLGPIQLGRGFNEGLLRTLRAKLAEDSASVTWRLFVGDTAEAAVNNAVTNTTPIDDWTGTFAAATVAYDHPQARGAASVLRITGGTRPWAMENIVAAVEELGIAR